jgi:hypothetical protein
VVEHLRTEFALFWATYFAGDAESGYFSDSLSDPKTASESFPALGNGDDADGGYFFQRKTP